MNTAYVTYGSMIASQLYLSVPTSRENRSSGSSSCSGTRRTTSSLRIAAAAAAATGKAPAAAANAPAAATATVTTMAASSAAASWSSSLPVILVDVMDTIVYDPFFTDMPRFFGMSFQQLMREKDPKAWVEFERGEID